jgi:hypothetical protein
MDWRRRFVGDELMPYCQDVYDHGERATEFVFRNDWL